MDFSVIVKTLERASLAMPGLVVVAVALLLGKWIFDRTHAFDENQQIEDQQNAAFGVVYAAYFVALALAMAGALFQSGEASVWLVAAKILGECGLVLILMRASLWVNDRFILSKFSVNKEILEDRNLGVALCVAGALIATGLSLNGALTGYSPSHLITFREERLLAFRDILLYWAFGQVILIVGARLYQWTAGYDVHRIIELDDNTAVGMSFGGYLVGLGIVARASLVGAGRDPLGNEILRTLTIAVIGVALLIASRVLIDLVFLKRSNLNSEISLDDNLAAGALAMGGYLATAILLAACLHR